VGANLKRHAGRETAAALVGAKRARSTARMPPPPLGVLILRFSLKSKKEKKNEK
jgi:hypothetical protein